MRPMHLALASLLLPLALAACAKPEGESSDQPKAATAPVAAPAAESTAPAATASDACAMVSAEQMSAILGTPMKAAPSPPVQGKSECTYMPNEGFSPYAIITVVPGDGEAAMTAMGVADDTEPGLASPYAGIGDEAFLVGEMLNIRSGQALVQITLSGVHDVPGKARAVFDAVKAKM